MVSVPQLEEAGISDSKEFEGSSRLHCFETDLGSEFIILTSFNYNVERLNSTHFAESSTWVTVSLDFHPESAQTSVSNLSYQDKGTDESSDWGRDNFTFPQELTEDDFPFSFSEGIATHTPHTQLSFTLSFAASFVEEKTGEDPLTVETGWVTSLNVTVGAQEEVGTVTETMNTLEFFLVGGFVGLLGLKRLARRRIKKQL